MLELPVPQPVPAELRAAVSTTRFGHVAASPWKRHHVNTSNIGKEGEA